MTLILTLANARGVYQSSDYQLTDAHSGAPVSDDAGSKQVEASFTTVHLGLAFTGIATVGSGSSSRRLVDWLSEELKRLPTDSTIDDICRALAKCGTVAMKPHGPRGVLTLVATFAVVGDRFRVAVISNADWRKHPPQARSAFSVDVHTIKKPFQLISGCREAVPALRRYQLEGLARSAERPSFEIMSELTAINKLAAGRSNGYVSEACWVTSQVANGQSPSLGDTERGTTRRHYSSDIRRVRHMT